MNCRGKSISFGSITHIMGVLNVTPDSFSDGGDYLEVNTAIAHAKTMVAEGATIIDIGGESSRPGAEPVPVEAELHRVLPVIRALVSEQLDVLLSIDTTKAEVAQQALEAGAHIINDITALRGDAAMAHVATEMEAGVILMHMKGTPRTMQQSPQYQNVVEEVYGALENWTNDATQNGIEPNRIIVDPGVGFGKTIEQNLQILKHLDIFKQLNKPILIGTSRKSFIGNLLDLPVTERVEGSLATACWAITHGADIVRVHDVKATVRAARMIDTLYR
ncbi:MAG: dihydropteroate synthase [Candidatus Poribacteria bacterium]|nr:dihydropteroate synthase [Candidatus Poribacteria bacterium]